MAVITSTYSFVRFDKTDYELPYYDSSEIAFQVYSDDEITAVRAVKLNGDVIETLDDIIFQIDTNRYFIYPQFSHHQDCFRIQLLQDENVIAESNIFGRVSEKRLQYTSLIRYRNDGNDFDFTYCPVFVINTVRLPLHIKEPQFSQNQTTYAQLDGRIRTTSATISKEYQLETNYITEILHNQLVIALSHDWVWINDKLLTKTGAYTIDWTNVLRKNDMKYSKATCAMTENVISRNSNCGSTCESEDFEVFPLSIIFREENGETGNNLIDVTGSLIDVTGNIIDV